MNKKDGNMVDTGLVDVSRNVKQLAGGEMARFELPFDHLNVCL